MLLWIDVLLTMSEDHGSHPGRQETGLQDQDISSDQKRWKLPAWLDHFKAHDLKIVFRCWAAAWVATILIFIRPALVNIGQATFFGALLLYIVPPASVLFIYLLAALSLLLGMCLAWLWGLLTMKAALAARPDSDTQAKLLALRQQASLEAQSSGQPPALVAQILVHDGFMLDARVTVVFYVMSCAFIYMLARLRCNNAKLIVFQLFGTIVTNLFLLFGPSLLAFNASLGSVLVKPGAIGIGLGTACCLLLFPQSTSYVVLEKMEKLIRMTERSIATTEKRLADQPLQLDQLKAAKGGMIGLYKAIDPLLAFLPLDFSRGRWNSEDVKGFHASVREVMISSLSLLDLHISWVTGTQKEEYLEMHRSALKAGQAENSEKLSNDASRHEVLESVVLMDAFRSPDSGDIRSRTFDAMKETTSAVLQTCSQSIKLAATCIRTVNSCRWVNKPGQERFDELSKELQDSIETLRYARAKSVEQTTERLLEIHADLFDESGQLKAPEKLGPPSLRGIVIAMVLEERIVTMSTAIEKLHEHILQLMKTRTSHHIWFPSRIRYGFSWLINGRQSVSISGTSTDTAEDPDAMTDAASLEQQASEAHRRLRISRGYAGSSAKRSLPSRIIIGTFGWLTNPAGMFALRMVVVTIATGIPSAIPHSAGFFYREKGIWGVITAQTSLLVYMADFTFSLASRGLGTVIGGVMGMVAWYIGSGSGPGNPYGMGAITALMILIIVWWRIFLPPAYVKAVILAGATFSLVVGFSYDESHIQQYGLPGKGYVAFWKRLVTVLLGFVAAAVVQCLPTPPSGTEHVCRTLANTMRTLSDHYALLLAHWGRPQGQSPLGAVAEEISLEVAEKLLSLNEMIGMLQFEMSLGPFDRKILKQVQEHCQEINQSLRRLLVLSTSLPSDLQERFVQMVGILDDGSIGDIMAVLSLIEQTLRTGSPLPQRLPTPLVRRFLDSWQAHHYHAILNTSVIRDESYRRYCVALSSYLKLLSTIDDLVIVLKGALGESHLVHQWEDV